MTKSRHSRRPQSKDLPHPKVRYARSADVRQINARLMQVHHRVLQKVAR